jgi:NhaA family Na+:H+ antiporter
MQNDKILSPFQKFAKLESLSGMLLLGASLIALFWANSAASNSYFSIWQIELGFSFGDFTLYKPLILWINDGLMAIFFFLIGLEIKRELLIGELDSLKKASLPLFAAVGGILVPLAIFFLLNRNPDTADGWGIPMATDIAFTLAILKALGKRVPISLKIFLTAFAIVDDLGAVLIIAIFYSASIQWMLIVYALGLLSLLFWLSAKGYFRTWIMLAIGAVIWYLFLKSGIHPTIAGVLLAFTVPIRQKINIPIFLSRLKHLSNKVINTPNNTVPILSKEQLSLVGDLEILTEEVNSPLQHIEYKLHYWVAYFIMPIFALSNAGVNFVSATEIDVPLVVTIALALVIGKGIGISLLSYIGLKLNLATRPAGTNFTQIIGVAALAGLGFTMSIFITNLAFVGQSVYLDSSKVGVIIGSVTAGILGYCILRFGKKGEVTDESIEED